MSSSNPILNNPYLTPTFHYATSLDGELNYDDVRAGRRIFASEQPSIPVRQGLQKSLYEVNDFAATYETHLVNLLRKEVGQWRNAGYEGNTTRVTRELLQHWFADDPASDIPRKKLFFAQQEAIETAIWLNEVAPRSNAGTAVLQRLRDSQLEQANGLPRVAFKMATGTGKTVVMAALILYHYFNRQEYRNDPRFADVFLLVAPGVTIRDRLGVLRVDTSTDDRHRASDYYRQRNLVPTQFDGLLEGLNARLVIRNYHAFEPKVLQGNKKSPFDGKVSRKVNEAGEVVTEKNDIGGENKEDFGQVIKRVMNGLKPGSRLLVINDEAHHCYLPREKGRNTEEADTEEENKRAAVWFTGLSEVAKRYQLAGVYDLSATPYYLNGSGYLAYSLFPWVVSDFGLTEAIESGLVKIPFLPESDDTQQLSEPVLRDLYRHVKESLPKKGQTAQKREAKKEGKAAPSEAKPKLHETLVAAMDQFYGHYEDDFQRVQGLFGAPPVFIAVCNNTTVSKEIYKHVAGFEYEDEQGERRVVPGHFSLFNNFDVYGRPLNRPPTLLIDSAALEDGAQVDDEFKRVFAPEIEKFKREYAHFRGQGSAEQVTDAEILREVVNTVGKPNALGSHVRCVVSVSMLTEGWDANTVTHIMGLRAFGSQLLCEQVAGRALRRKHYDLLPYDARTNEAVDPKLWRKYNLANLVWKFPPEYAQIIGVPFKTFKKGEATTVEPPEYTRIDALPQREAEYEISFPNVVGYRVETGDEALTADFSELENYLIDFSSVPVRTTMANAFSSETQKLEFDSVLDVRDQSVVYRITQQLINYHHADLNGQAYVQRFPQLRRIVETWYETKVSLAHQTDPVYKRILYFLDLKPVADHIQRGIMAATRGTDRILPVLNHYNRFGSTRYVHGTTSKPVFPTAKSHVNYVVADTESWEQIAAKTLEELPEVLSYAKNAFLGFTIPYVNNGKESLYYPDFIVRLRTASGQTANLILEITGMNRDKEAKRWYVQNRWLPAVNGVLDELGTDPWYFAEVANDIRFVRNQLRDEIGRIGQTLERIAKLKASFGTIKNAPPLTSEQLRREAIYED